MHAAIGFRAKHPKVELTIWADVETRLPMRIEQRDSQLFIACTEFQFDAPMDESLFSMDIPDGYGEQETELDLLGSTEDDFIEGLRVWAEAIGDGRYPDSVSVESFIAQAPMLKRKFEELGLSDETELEMGLKLQRYLLFIRFFKGEGKWHYGGKSVKLGDADTAIFWYRPHGSTTYRVIYGDLSVRDVPPEDLPHPVNVNDESVRSIGYQEWPRHQFAGTQEDEWHVTRSGNIVAHSHVTLVKGPANTSIVPVVLAYPGGELTAASCGGEPIRFYGVSEGRHKLELPMAKLHAGETEIRCTWEFPLRDLRMPEGEYRCPLASLIPVTSYRLAIMLDPGCGLRHAEDASKQRWTPFTWNTGGPEPKSQFGTCGLPLSLRHEQ